MSECIAWLCVIINNDGYIHLHEVKLEEMGSCFHFKVGLYWYVLISIKYLNFGRIHPVVFKYMYINFRHSAAQHMIL